MQFLCNYQAGNGYLVSICDTSVILNRDATQVTISIPSLIPKAMIDTASGANAFMLTAMADQSVLGVVNLGGAEIPFPFFLPYFTR